MSEATKQEIEEMVTILTNLDESGRTIMMANASALLARKELEESRRQREEQCMN